MSDDYGRHRLAGLALAQIEQAENDPRAAADVGLRDAFYAARGEAENLRILTQLGLSKLHGQVSGEPSTDSNTLQAKWQQSYMAKLMIDREYPYLNGMTLVAIYSAVDALIERMVSRANR